MDPLLWSMPCSLVGSSDMDPGYSNSPKSPWSPQYPSPREPPALTASWQWLPLLFWNSLLSSVFYTIGNREHICTLHSLFQVAVMKTENTKQSRESPRKTQSEERHRAWGTGERNITVFIWNREKFGTDIIQCGFTDSELNNRRTTLQKRAWRSWMKGWPCWLCAPAVSKANHALGHISKSTVSK